MRTRGFHAPDYQELGFNHEEKQILFISTAQELNVGFHEWFLAAEKRYIYLAQKSKKIKKKTLQDEFDPKISWLGRMFHFLEDLFCCDLSILAQVSRRVTVRLKTGALSFESAESTQK